MVDEIPVPCGRAGFTYIVSLCLLSDPPSPPRIFNEKREFVNGRAGPYEEGTELHLICVVTGGSPPPTITWSTNGHIVAGTATDFSFPYSQSSKLVVHNLSRVHQNSVYTCQASNFEEKVVATNVTIELYRKWRERSAGLFGKVQKNCW